MAALAGPSWLWHCLVALGTVLYKVEVTKPAYKASTGFTLDFMCSFIGLASPSIRDFSHQGTTTSLQTQVEGSGLLRVSFTGLCLVVFS